MSSEFEEYLRERERAEDDARRTAIDTISELYPPDSCFEDTRENARVDLMDALCSEWRSLPLPVLEYMARVQRQRDHSL